MPYYKLSDIDSYIRVSENVEPICNTKAPDLFCPEFEAAKFVSIAKNIRTGESQRLLLKNFSRNELGEYITCKDRSSMFENTIGLKLSIPYTQAISFFCVPSQAMIADKTPYLRYRDIVVLFAIDTTRGDCKINKNLTSGTITILNDNIFQDKDELGLKENDSWTNIFVPSITKAWDSLDNSSFIPFRLKAPPGYENQKYIKYGDPIIFEAINNNNKIMFNECQNERVVLSDKNPKIDNDLNLISGGNKFSEESYLFRFFTDDYDGIPCEVTDYKGYCLNKNGNNFLYDEKCLTYCQENQGACDSIKLEYCKGDNLIKPLCSTFCAKNSSCQLALKDYCKDKNPGSSPEIRKVCGCFYPDAIYAQYQKSLAKKLGLDVPMEDSIGCFPDCDNSDIKPDTRKCQRNIVNCVSNLHIDNFGEITADNDVIINDNQDCSILKGKDKGDDENKNKPTTPSGFKSEYIILGAGALISIIIIIMFVLLLKK